MMSVRELLIGTIVCLNLCFSGYGWAQTVQPPEQPAMSIADVPLSPAEASGRVAKLTSRDAAGNVIHMMPTVDVAAARAQAGSVIVPNGTSAGSNPVGPLRYHLGGQVMQAVNVYNIFWAPNGLQNGAATSLSASYANVISVMSAEYPTQALLRIATQYYQRINGQLSFIHAVGSLAGRYFDTTPYPVSACNDRLTPGNCLTGDQMVAEIRKVMRIRGWTGGLDKVFMLYTSSGEGSCFDKTSNDCAYKEYCAYHSSFTSGVSHVLYGIVPYGSPSHCKTSRQTTPNDAFADLAANVASHELEETATDPLGNAWFSSAGLEGEISDLCNFNFGINRYDGGQANQSWTGSFFELQEAWSNHANGCVQTPGG